jgi:hypothetical protein
MGKLGAVAVILGVSGGLLVWFLCALCIDGNMGFGAGLLAGGFIWKHFDNKDKAELAEILNPPPYFFDAPLPVVWGSVLDVFHHSYVDSGISGRVMWQVVGEDDVRGVIRAKLTFQQLLGAGATARPFQRAIDVEVNLIGEEAGTKVISNYSIFSPSGNDLARDAVKKVQAAIKDSVIANKEIEGC